MVMTKITAEWTNFTGGPGYSNFYFRGSLDATQTGTAAVAVRNFFNAFVQYLPTALTIRLTGIARHMTEADGGTVDQFSYAPGAVVLGAATGSFSAVSGASMRWPTGGVVANRVVTGKTYLVPLVGAYDTDGSLAGTFLTAAVAAGNTLAGSFPAGSNGRLQVWSRPAPGRNGQTFDVSGAAMNDRVAAMRSRRD